MIDVQPLTARHAAVCLTLRGLLDRLIEIEVLRPSDILAIRDFAVNFEPDIGDSIPAGEPDLYPEIKKEVLTLWDSLGVPRAVAGETRSAHRNQPTS